MNKIFSILMILGCSFAFAQNASSYYDNRIPKVNYFSTEVCNTSDVKSMQVYLEKQLNCNLTLTHTAKSEYSTVYTFTQNKNDIEVYHGFAKVILDNNSRTFRVTYILFTGMPEVTNSRTGACWYNYNNNWLAATKTVQFNPEQNSLFEIIRDENNNVISKKDLALHGQLIDSTIRVKVFNPDPLTSAHKMYGAPYMDYNDSDVVAINAQRVWENVTCKFLNDTFWLMNKYLVPFKAPSHSNFNPVYRVKDTVFDYTRHQLQFEDVMVFYHITNYQNHLSSLGFSNIGLRPDNYDAHGQTDDNSMYLPGVGLIFGTGGIDDAEDAEIITHEYSHSLREFVSPSTNNGLERQSLEEGFMDYLSTSYKMDIDSFGWKKWAFWDGNNAAESWFGRNVASPKIYPQDLNGSVYDNSEIWSSAMLRIFLKLGRTITDKLAIQTFYYLTDNLSMTQTAMLVIKADSVLFNGIHTDVICNTFSETHILPWCNAGINSVSKINDAVKLINSLNFTQGKGNLLVYLPEEEKGIYTITNNLGQILSQKNFYDDKFSLPSGLIRTPGIYYLTITTPSYTKTRKFVIK